MLDRASLPYAACYCEENVFLLAAALVDAGLTATIAGIKDSSGDWPNTRGMLERLL